MIYTLQEGFVFRYLMAKNMHILYSYRSGTEEEYDELYRLRRYFLVPERYG